MILYAIKLKGTDRFLPSRKRRGFTFDDPVSIKEKLPRLFPSRKNAHLALKAWCKGQFVHRVYTGGYPDYEPDEDVVIKHQDSRKYENMEIVSFELIEKTP